MARRVDELIDQIVQTLQELPAEQAAEVLDFASYLHSRYALTLPERGSATAILTALDTHGLLEFAPGELDVLLDEIDQARERDLSSSPADRRY